jgi:hypothetical protein
MRTYRSCDFKSDDLGNNCTQLQHTQGQLTVAQSYVHHLETELHERDEQLEVSQAQAADLQHKVELPTMLSGVHNVFHVSQHKRCLKPLTDVVIEDTIPFEPDLAYKAHPIKVLGQQDGVTCNKTTQFYKIQWNDHFEDQSTWEHEEFLRSNYPEFLPSR